MYEGKIEKNFSGLSGQETRMPAFFIGHGSPMNAIVHNDFTRSLAKMAEDLPIQPSAILVISAHWMTSGVYVLSAAHPRTIYDFGGFPDALYHIIYPAPGTPDLAQQTIKMVSTPKLIEDSSWGLDHGAWTILLHMFPKANIPVYQLSLDYKKAPSYHYDLARQLSGLRDKGVLIIGSGNIVHNLYQIKASPDASPFDWTLEFDMHIKRALDNRDLNKLTHYEAFGSAAALAVPTSEHYLPLLYTMGVSNNTDLLTYTYEGMEHGSLSMRSFRIG